LSNSALNFGESAPASADISPKPSSSSSSLGRPLDPGSQVPDGLLGLLHPGLFNLAESPSTPRESCLDLGGFGFDEFLALFGQVADSVSHGNGRHVAPAPEIIRRVFGADNRRKITNRRNHFAEDEGDGKVAGARCRQLLDDSLRQSRVIPQPLQDN